MENAKDTTSAKHTPGPWHRNGIWIVGADDTLVLQAPGINEPLHAHNLDLAAAAPDLLDALRDTMRGDQFSDMAIILEQAGHPQLAKFWREHRARAVAAIAEAEGKTP